MCSIVDAYKNNELEVKETWNNPNTIAAGLRVPHPYASYLILRILKETKGIAIEVDDKEIISSIKQFFKMNIRNLYGFICMLVKITILSRPIN